MNHHAVFNGLKFLANFLWLMALPESDIGVAEEIISKTNEKSPVNEIQPTKDDDILVRTGEERTASHSPKHVHPGNYEEERMAETILPVPLEQLPRIIKRRIPSPVYIPSFNYTDKAFFTGLILVTILSFGTRLYKLNEPQHVAWDETHFGKHASWYIQGKFFFDVHPPLGKLVIATAGVLSGYNGSFEFKEPGQKYEDTPYYGMRLGCVLFGILLVPLAYLIVWELAHSICAALLAATAVICETGTLTLSQYILLDPLLMFFVMASTYCAVKFSTFYNEPFSLEWWYFMTLTGIFLGCTISVKWVGLFVVLLVGLMTIRDLWILLGDLTLSMKSLMQHFLARVLCLILVPGLLYTSIFGLHFLALRYSGNGDGFFSSEFQATLEGNELYNQQVPEFLGYGAVATFKHHRGGGGLLHSHSHLYPEDMAEIQQQQITAYSHKDDNNKWIVKKTTANSARTNKTLTDDLDSNKTLTDDLDSNKTLTDDLDSNKTFTEDLDADKTLTEDLDADKTLTEDLDSTDEDIIIKHGDHVVLEHLMTKRNLHSHTSVNAPLTKTHFQVTAYGQDGVGDSNDYWEVEIEGGVKGDPVRTVASKIRFRHVNTNCYLHSHSQQLPKWGWEQLEVSCNPRRNDPHNLWNVEGNYNPKLPNISFGFYKPGFFSKLIESHIVMAESNNNMKPKEGEQTSKPWHWPMDWQGQVFSGGDYRIYLLGNPVLFWGSDVLLVLFLFMVVIKIIADQRSVNYISVAVHVDRFISGGLFLILGWALHYLPFYLMGRVLYFHHYFPALMFILMLGAIVLECSIRLLTSFFQSRMKPIFYYSSLVLIFSVVIGSFVVFSPLSYGMSGAKADSPESQMYGLKWLSTWDI